MVSSQSNKFLLFGNYFKNEIAQNRALLRNLAIAKLRNLARFGAILGTFTQFRAIWRNFARFCEIRQVTETPCMSDNEIVHVLHTVSVIFGDMDEKIRCV